MPQIKHYRVIADLKVKILDEATGETISLIGVVHPERGDSTESGLDARGVRQVIGRAVDRAVEGCAPLVDGVAEREHRTLRRRPDGRP
jgi:hypothetical protein